MNKLFLTEGVGVHTSEHCWNLFYISTLATYYVIVEEGRLRTRYTSPITSQCALKLNAADTQTNFDRAYSGVSW